MFSNPFISEPLTVFTTAEILNLITKNTFKIIFQILKQLKRQACLKVYYLLFVHLNIVYIVIEKKRAFCTLNHSRYLSGLYFIILFY